MSSSGPPSRPRLPQVRPTAQDLDRLDAEIARLQTVRTKAVAKDDVEEISEVDIVLEENANVIAEARGQASSAGIAFRRSPRFRVSAAVLLDHEGKQARLSIVNLSATGALIAYDVEGQRETGSG